MKLNFVIPIRHPSGVKNPDQQLHHLSQTVKSIENQSSKDWFLFIVANKGQKLPKLPKNSLVKWVEFEPNAKLEVAIDRIEIYSAIRRDKGMRVAEAAKDVASTDYIMVVDDDDLISRQIAQFVNTSSEHCGWYVDSGYLWIDNSRMITKVNQLYKKCGTTLVIPKSMYRFSDDPDSAESLDELGSHKLIFDRFPCEAPYWKKFPFSAAIYRLGHGNASQRQINTSLINSKNQIVYPKKSSVSLLGRLRVYVRKIRSMRMLNDRIISEFFGTVDG